MEVLGWFFSAMFWVVYIVALFTVCMLTFQKGHTLLGIVLPFLLLIGGIQPAKAGWRYVVQHSTAQHA